MIAIENLSYTYPHAKSPALKSLNIQIDQGELVLITGASGSGKSTLFYCLKGLLPHQYGGTLKGRISVNGQDVGSMSIADIAKLVGLVMQDPEDQFCNLFVRDEVAFGVENLKLKPSICIELTLNALEVVGLEGMSDRIVVELSGGEKQKTAVASILAMDTPILLFDEPTANLDARSGREVLRFIASLCRGGKTILVIQHELDELIDCTDKLLVLEQGAVLDFGSPRVLIKKYENLLPNARSIGLPQITKAALATRQWIAFEQLPLNAQEFASQVEAPSGADTTSIEIYSTTPPTDQNGNEFIVEAEDINFSYPYSKETAIRNVSLKVRAGETIAIVGKTGSGKSTLARLLVGLLKPGNGIIKIGGMNVASVSEYQIQRQVGYVFQYPEHQFLADNVYDEIAYGLDVQGVPIEEREHIVKAIIQSIGLRELEDRHPFSLSGGEKRRLSVATMLVLNPKLLILDEPTYGLDESNVDKMMQLLFKQMRERDITIIFITHNMTLVAEHAERLLVIDQGEVVFAGEPTEAFTNRDLMEHARLLPPPIFMLAEELRRQGLPIPRYTITLRQFHKTIEDIFRINARGTI